MAIRRALMPALFSSATSVAQAFQVGGYVENWKPCAPRYLEDVDVVYYAYLTLDTHPDWYSPKDKFWDGQALTESKTLAPIQDVLKNVGGDHEWQRLIITSILDWCRSNGKKFVWTIGGWSDLVRTLRDDQINTFATQVVNLLKVAGDGVDLDWEHISEGDQNDKESWSQRRHIIGKTIKAIWSKLREAGMSDKTISYTARFNCFWTPSDANDAWAMSWPTDGECLDSFKHAVVEHVNWVNLKMYDVSASMVWRWSEFFRTPHFEIVLASAAKHLPKEKIMIGFEPGFQAAHGVWEGFDVDFEVIDRMHRSGYGGVFFWAMNEASNWWDPETPHSQHGHIWQGSTGDNAQYMAKKIKSMSTFQQVQSHNHSIVV